MKHFFITAFAFFFTIFAAAQTAPKGHLVIIGGGINTSDIMDAFIEYAGGPQAKFLVISTAGHRKGGRVTTQIDGEKFISQLAEKGAMNASWADPTRKENDDSVYVAKLLDGVTGVFFTGGYQSSIVKEMRGTKMHEALMKKYEKDGIVIGGTSAGAGMMTDPMISGSKLKTDEKGVKEESVTSIEPDRAMISPGMGFLKNAIIDQHVIVRSRENRMFSAAMDMPQVTTFGIDESTAIVISDGNKVKVVGESSVFVIEVSKNDVKTNRNGLYGISGMTVRLLVDGDTYTIPAK